MFTTILVEPLANGLILFYNLLGENLGLAIIAFTLALRLLLNPLTKPYLESMKKMKEYQKDLNKLKEKHKDDKLKLTQAQADFYKEKGINPGAGCIPYLLQIVVLIAFFQVFTKTLTADMSPTDGFNTLLYPAMQFDEGHVLNTNFLGYDLSQPDTINMAGLPFALPGLMLIFAALAQLASSLIMAPASAVGEKVAEKTKGEGDDLQAQMQKSMMFTFPLFTLFIGLRFPAALVLYWLVISAYQAYQQYRISGPGELATLTSRLGLVKSGGKTKNGKRK